MKRGLLLCLFLGALVQSCTKQELKGSSQLAPSRFNVNANEPSYKLQDEAGEVSWYINFDWYQLNGIVDSRVTNQIFADTKTKINFMRGNDDRLNQMIASNELPDLITVDSNSSFAQSANRWAIDLNTLADAYDPYFYQVIKPDAFSWHKNSDGKTYGYPNEATTHADLYKENTHVVGSQAFIVRSDIYKAIGSPDMRTPEGFLQALRDAKAYNPNVIPLTLEALNIGGGTAGNMLQALLAIPRIKDGKYYEAYLDEEYIRWLDVLRQAYQEDLIIDDNFAFHEDQYFDDIIHGNYFAIFVGNLYGARSAISTFGINNPDKTYIAIDGPSNRNLDPAAFGSATLGGWTLTFVSKQAKDKERVMQLLTYMISYPGQVVVSMGEEGETFYRDNEGVYHFTPQAIELRSSDPAQYQKENNIGILWMFQGSGAQAITSDWMEIPMKQIWGWTQGKQHDRYAIDQTDPEPRSNEAKIWTNYHIERGDTVMRAIRTKNAEDFELEIAKLKELYEKESTQQALAVINQKIQANLDKLDRLGITH